MRTNAAELMHGGKSADRRMVSHRDMAGKRCRICHDDVVSHDAIVSDVTVGHQKIIIPDHGDSMPSLGAAVQGDKFPEHVVVADLQVRRFSLVFEILRICSDGAVAVKMASLADGSPPVDVDMGIQDSAGSNPGLRADDAIGADFGFRGNFSCPVDNCSRMYGHAVQIRISSKRHSSWSEAIYYGAGKLRFNCHVAIDQSLPHHFEIAIALLQNRYFNPELIARNDGLAKAAFIDSREIDQLGLPDLDRRRAEG